MSCWCRVLHEPNELRKVGVFVSASGVCSIWLRHDLACFKDRLKALEKHVAAAGEVLTESQLQALESKEGRETNGVLPQHILP